MCKISSLWQGIQRKVIHISIWEILILCLNLHCTCTQKSVQNQTKGLWYDQASWFFTVACTKTKACWMINYPISLNNSRPSINHLPQIIAPLWWKYYWNNHLPWVSAPPPPPTLSPSSFSFIPSLSRWRGIWSSKTYQWWFKLWKFI